MTQHTIKLYNYKTGEPIREATKAELRDSIETAKHDGGAGVIEVDGVACYVVESGPSFATVNKGDGKVTP